MEQRAIDQIAKAARITRADQLAWAARRRRLERLASLLETTAAPVRMFSTMECYPKRERLALRQAGSALALAWSDPGFRREGLLGDSVGDAISFFNLSLSEAHALLCDCGYGGFARMNAPLNDLIAGRARALAAKRSVAEWLDRLAAVLRSTRARLALAAGDSKAHQGKAQGSKAWYGR